MTLTNNEEVYNELEKITLYLMDNYQTDLTTHDKNQITQYKPLYHMVHITRAWGTQLITFVPFTEYPKKGEQIRYLFGYAYREKILNDNRLFLEHIFKAFSDIKIVHYFNGIKWLKVTREQAQRHINNYVNSIKDQWERQERFNY